MNYATRDQRAGTHRAALDGRGQAEGGPAERLRSVTARRLRARLDGCARSRSSASRNLTAYYGPTPAVRDVTFDIYRNMVTAIIGPSGCGKSTFIRCLNRMNDGIRGFRTEGSILYHDIDLQGSNIDAGRRAAPNRNGLPAAEPVSEVDLRERRLRPQDPWPEGRPRADRSSAPSSAPRSGTRSRTGSRRVRCRSPAGSSSGSVSRAPSRSSPR